MKAAAALAAGAFLATAALAADAPSSLSAPDAPLSTGAAPSPPKGWVRQPSSLLLYADDGSLVQEIPLPEPEESGDATRDVRGGTSADGHLAWTLERRLTWSPGRTALLESRRMFRVYGTSGAALWWDADVDLPERGKPAAVSDDAKVLLLARRGKDGWRADARTWLGETILSLGPFPRLVEIQLTPRGRYALARWSVPDVSDTHTFVDLATKTRKDIPSSDLVLGSATVADDGVVRSGSKAVFSFQVAASTAAAPATK